MFEYLKNFFNKNSVSWKSNRIQGLQMKIKKFLRTFQESLKTKFEFKDFQRLYGACHDYEDGYHSLKDITTFIFMITL